MYGAFIGDTVGSPYEFANIKTKQFELFTKGCDYTDDTIMTIAMADAIMKVIRARETGERPDFQQVLTASMQYWGRRYPNPKGAYGGRFVQWLSEECPLPYGSWGNGSAMRTSPCAHIAVSPEEAKALARAGAAVTHDHAEGIRGAQAVTAAVYMAREGCSKEEIRHCIHTQYYTLNNTLDEIRPRYRFDASCQGTVPQALTAFLESESFEDAVRNVISIGGDSDTAGAITGSVAWAYYKTQAGNALTPDMLAMQESVLRYLPEEFVTLTREFEALCLARRAAARQGVAVSPILSEDENARYSLSWQPLAPYDTPRLSGEFVSLHKNR